MALRFYRSIIPATVMLLVTSGCAAHAVPASDGAYPALQTTSVAASYGRPADTTSILKKLTKDVVIGSTVDAKNGDEGPRSISIVPDNSHGLLTQGELLVCNFEDSNGVLGNGTTMEILKPTPNSTPVRFFQSDSIEGCDGDAITHKHGTVYGAGLTSGKIVVISKKGKAQKTYSGKSIADPFSDASSDPPQNFSPLYIYGGTTDGGGIVSISIGFYGNGLATQVAKGFGVSKGSQGLAPSGLQYDPAADTLYIVDGVTNTIVAFSNSSKLLDKDEIIVKPGGKTFTCKYPKTTCASLVYSGSPAERTDGIHAASQWQSHRCQYTRDGQYARRAHAAGSGARYEGGRLELDARRLRARRPWNERFQHGPLFHRYECEQRSRARAVRRTDAFTVEAFRGARPCAKPRRR